MVVDVKLCKEEGKPFGFRLIGGSDFELPLTCSKVSEEKNSPKKKSDNFLSKSFFHAQLNLQRDTLTFK
jgi:hypothetical protein